MKTIVICPFSYHGNLLRKVRTINPFVDVKFIDKQEILDSYFGQFRPGAINFIIKKFKVNYQLASIYLSNALYVNKGIVNNFKVDKLLEIKQALLEAGYFKKDVNFLKVLENQKVYILGYSAKDKQLIDILNQLNATFEFITYKSDLEKEIKMYQNGEDEIHHLFIDICDLIKTGIDIKDIYLYGVSDDYLSLVRRYKDLYNIPVNGLKTEKLRDFEFGKEFFKLYSGNRDAKLTLNLLDVNHINDANYVAFKDEVLANLDEELDFDEQFDIFNTKLKGEVKDVVYDNAITVLKDFTYLENKHIFVIGFKQGVYPMVKSDNDFLQDSIKSSLNIPTSKDENINNKDIMLNFLCMNNTYHFSFSYKSLSGVCYLSFLSDPLKLKKKEIEISLHDYSKNASQNELLKMKDLYDKYRQTKNEKLAYEAKIDFPYKTYDNQFKTFDAKHENDKIYHSYSALKEYTLCPFQYYLDKVLKLENVDDTFHLDLGTASHAILEEGLKDFSKDFEYLFNKHFIEERFSHKNWVFIKEIKKSLEVVLQVARDQIKQISNPQLFLEEDVSIPLSEKAILTGKIDKIIVNDNKYITLVDYKTGSEKFIEKHLQIGESLQLPCYAMMISSSPKFKDYKLGGLYINNILSGSLKERVDDPNEPENLRLNGKTLNDPNYVLAMEPNFLNEKGKYIKISPKKKGDTFSGAGFATADDFKNYINICREHYLKCDDAIRHNHFEISPRKIGNNLACDMCSYKDICYKKYSQIRMVKIEKEDK